MKLSVDTNAYRAFVDGDARFVDAIQRAETVAFSVVVLGELRAGFAHGTRAAENERVLSRVLATERVEVHEVGERTSATYARIWAALRKNGTPIPTNDVWIAAICLERGFTLLTRDPHFSPIPNLQVLP